MRFNQSQYSIFKSIIKIYLVFVVLIISACASLISEKTENAACKNLSKVTDIDSLLFQMYSNIDSNCLFEMPVEELEKIWGINILDNIGKNNSEIEKVNQKFSELRESNDIELFLFKSGIDNNDVHFAIYTSSAYSNKNGYGGSVGEWEFPKLLPPPSAKFPDPFFPPNPFPMEVGSPTDFRQLSKTTKYKSYSTYYWVNKRNLKNLPALIMKTSSNAEVSLIKFYQKKPNFLSF